MGLTWTFDSSRRTSDLPFFSSTEHHVKFIGQFPLIGSAFVWTSFLHINGTKVNSSNVIELFFFKTNINNNATQTVFQISYYSIAEKQETIQSG